ncbi:single-stranded DNA-binding protein [Leuconostoc pseudomesenteroides]|uniref:single-stranded DNA-binding protein n=1 Tax=Leuconostoc TaxID=1243 RepID=UPI001E34242A|nr:MULTISPECIES: single-stranded DNA-binding protein [Leuconostoc]MCC7669815.1 single-stranded DNA-binding protein [Leuconostoc pseudomesenteroides]MCT4380702.1 single-stranded DNA-binding protein [Leuconostoc pseudomesenteroides]MCT4383640.1 single-stranded DNA-binding protein [Leuconostoc suionicum]MCT4402201.1 single-stranded DNA-binding protein [Leuconostoc suionicum]MCT4404730.1 single-stranded DNA-binding protein [Leuconostoc falkenbergense]
MQINHHVGRLVRDVNFTVRGENETKIAYFKLAINDLKDGKATYIDYVAFNKTAELIRDYVTDVGQVVEVEFMMRNHNYTDKNTGQKIYAMQNLVTQFRIYKSNQSSKKPVDQTQVSDIRKSEVTDKDLPPYPDFSSNAFEYVEG